MATRIIDNFAGTLTRDNIGDLDSGKVKYATSFGYDPFANVGNLTWLENATQIDAAGSVITDCIMAAKPRLETGTTYVYAIGHTGRLYKIQVNQPGGVNPNLDTPVLLTTLSANGGSGNPITFKYGASMQFYGTTQQIYVGGDSGITRVNFDGTGETYMGTPTALNVPRPSVVFQGVSYWGNGTNLIAIDSTATVTTQTALAPALPVTLQIRDLDVSPEGNYIQIIASEIPGADLTVAAQDTNSLSSGNSFKYYWDALDPRINAFTTFGGYTINSNISFLNNSFTAGYDLGGMALYEGNVKQLSLPNALSPNFQAMFSTGNLLGLATPETTSGFLTGSIMFYGQYDQETTKGLFRFLRFSAGNPETDVTQMPCCLIVSNLFYGSSSTGYSGNQVGSAKIYFSTVETSSSPTLKYKFYKFTTVPTGLGTSISGVYETQNETSFRLFKSIITRKFKVNEVRLYTEPLDQNVQFKIDLIGSDGNPISGATKTFVVGSGPVAINTDVVKYTPQMVPTYSVGVRITNQGNVNWVGAKLELDYEESGSG